ncbi:uncharacterized protein LOC131425579 [Malaya genurostris]|uniref:uncharacterized protein LOC131425579 n=1 Tax=Malaya genurostris TaxID=325434 RepID=UPI0026F3C3D5|nr:uncharacterized protein LOC131425579 [Malaya genurostris]
MSFFTSFQELLDFDHSTNLNGFHFSNSLFGFDSNSIPTLENNHLPGPVPLDSSVTTVNSRALLKTPSPIPEPAPLLETPKHCPFIQPVQPTVQQQQQQQPHLQHETTPSQSHHQTSPVPIVSKFQLKVTPNNEIYISNESGTFCELAGSFVPSQEIERPAPAPTPQIQCPIVTKPNQPSSCVEPVFVEPPVANGIPPDPPSKTLYCIEKGIKRPLSPSDCRYGNSGIFRSAEADASPLKKKTTSNTSNGLFCGGSEAKLVVSNVINNGLIVNKKHLSTTEEPSGVPTPERRIMRPKKRKKKVVPKVLLSAKVEPLNGKIVARVAPEPARPLAMATIRKLPPEAAGKRLVTTGGVANSMLKTTTPAKVPVSALSTVASATVHGDSALNFSGIKEKAAQEAIFVERVEKKVPQHHQEILGATAPLNAAAKMSPPTTERNRVESAADVGLMSEDAGSSPAPVELKVVADLVMDKNVFGHISLLNNSHDRGKTVIYQNPVTSTNVIYSILNPKSLNLNLGGGVGRGATATLTLQPHRGVRKPKKRGRKKKVPTETINGGAAAEGVNPLVLHSEPKPVVDPDVPVSVTRSGRLSKPPRYANNYFQNIKQKTEHSPPPPPPLPPPLLPKLDLPAPDPETAEKLPNFSAALSSTVSPASVSPGSLGDAKRKMKVPLQYRCSTCNKVYLGKRMQRHLQKYPSHNSERDCVGPEREKKTEKEEKSTYLYKHLFDLLQKFTEKDKGRVMLKEISNFVDFVRALIPRLITNEEQNSTVEYIDHNVADVLRLNHGKYRLKLSSLAEEYEKLNHTVSLLNNNNPSNPSNGISPPQNGSTVPPLTSTPNGNAERQSFTFNADDLLNQSSSFPSLSTLVTEHNLLVHSCSNNNNNNNSNNNNNNNIHPHHQHQHNNNHHPLQNPHPHHGGNNLYNHHNHHHHHHHLHLNHLPPVVGSNGHDDAINSLSGLCKSPVQHSTSGMVNMALNLY